MKMISGRMFEIIRYLNEKRTSSYRDICKALDLKERSVRYDIDSINNVLSTKGLSQIEKQSKGKLIVPLDVDLYMLLEDSQFIFLPEEREDIIRLIILFNITELNITKISELFQVTRRSVKKSVDNVMESLAVYSMKLVYDKTFSLIEDYDTGYSLRVSELKKYVYLMNKKEYEYSTFELYVMKFIQEIYGDVSIKDLYHWINNRIETMSWSFSDNSFDWYVSNILTTCWCILNKYHLPITQNDIDVENNSLDEISAIINCKLTLQQKKLISRFSSYTNKYVDLDINLNLIMTEDIISQLVSMMSEELEVYFMRDMILIKGLLNHVAPMLERVKDNIYMYDMDPTIIPESYVYIYETLKQCIAKIPFLSELTKEEMIYLSIHFIGSVQRLRHNEFKKVLLICGLGYGSTALLKDTLRNEYQVHVLESISIYELDNYANWQNVDIVISIPKINLPVKKPLVMVNVIFTQEDHNKLKNIGIRKKNVLTNYIAIEKRLHFLAESDRHKTISIIQEELGYSDVNIPNKYYNLSDLLGIDCIRIIDKVEHWKDAIRLATGMLVDTGCVRESYYYDIASGIEESGFYSVTDESFALFHGGNTDSILISNISLIVSKTPVLFGNKQVNIMFCLASKDRKEHIPAIVKLMRMVNNTDFIEAIKKCNSENEVMRVIHRCETEVLACYP